SARISSSRSRMAARPSATAARSSRPKERTAPAMSADTRSGRYRSTVCLSSRLSQNDSPNPNPMPTNSQNSRLNIALLGLGATAAEAAGGATGAGRERDRLDDRVREREVREP